MKQEIIKMIEEKQLKKDVAKFGIGDKVRVQSKIVEGGKTRTQAFEGTVIMKHNGSSRANFTVRKVVASVGVEKTFVLHSPNVVEIAVIKRGKVKRARLFYLRQRVGSKATRIKDAQ